MSNMEEPDPNAKVCALVGLVLVLNAILALSLPTLLGFSFVEISIQLNSGNVGQVSTDSLAIFGSFVASQGLALFFSLIVMTIYGLRMNGREMNHGYQNPGIYACLAGVFSLYPIVFITSVFFGIITQFFLGGGGLVCGLITAILGCAVGTAECCCIGRRPAMIATGSKESL